MGVVGEIVERVMERMHGKVEIMEEEVILCAPIITVLSA
jgi:hypothetical protein